MTARLVKIGGSLFLIFTVLGAIHFMWIDTKILLPEDTGAVIQYIRNNALNFRIGILLDLIIFATGMFLALALYILFKPINRLLSLLALIWFVIETGISITIELSSFALLSTIDKPENPEAIDGEYLQSLTRLVIDIRAEGYSIVAVFFALAMMIFSFLFYKSGYIPKIVALWGFLSFLLMFLALTVNIILPDGVAASTGNIASLSAMLFQITLGIWLLIKHEQISATYNLRN